MPIKKRFNMQNPSIFYFRKSDDTSKEAKAKVCESNPSKPKKAFCNEVEEAMSGGTNKVNMLYSW